jgi:nucleoside-diphosphate-sugar epimerase
LAVERGIDLYLLNRARSLRPAPAGATVLSGDIRDAESARRSLAGHTFDAVVNWVAYTADHVRADIEFFRGRTGQYVFISSASVYQKPPASLPITESTPLHNPFWQYSRDKIACEHVLTQAYRESGFPVTIVRPSHTYDKITLPIHGGYTVIDRMRRGKKVVVHGDGTSLWVLTHHRDFAKGFVGLLGNPHVIGDAYHITSDEVLTWNQIHEILGRAAGAEAQFVHLPSELVAAYDARWGAGLLGDKTHSVIFDNTKIKRIVPDFAATIPFVWGAQESIAWYDEDAARRMVDAQFNDMCDRMIANYESAWP